MTPSTVAQKAFSGAFAMGIRQIFGLLINLLGNILLARLLSPEDYGIYAVLSFALHFLTTFGDIGLGASLIRQREEPEKEDYQAVFTIQQIILVVIVLLFWFLAPLISSIYDISQSNIWLFRIVALSLFFTSFSVIPSIRLERKLEFNRLAVIEVVQTVVYNLVAVVAAYLGAGPLSFALALLSRSISGAVLINFTSPWQIGWHWDWKRVRTHLSFGLPYQGVGLLSTLNSAINPTVIGLVFGLHSAGFIAWASGLVEQLYRPLFMINRVLYPTYSRLDPKSEELGKVVNFTYMATGLIHFGLASILFGLAPLVIKVIYTDKWLPGLSIVYLLVLATIFYPMSIPNGALAYSLGWSKTVLNINVVKTLSFWGLVLLFIRLTGSHLSYAYALLITEFIHLVLYSLLKKDIPAINVFVSQFPAQLSGVIVAGMLSFFANQVPDAGVVQLIAGASIGGIGFLVLSLFFGWISTRLFADSPYQQAFTLSRKYILERKALR